MLPINIDIKFPISHGALQPTLKPEASRLLVRLYPSHVQKCKTIDFLEGQGDLVSGLIMGILRVTIWVIRVINLLTKSP